MSLIQVANQIIIIFALMVLGALIRESGFLHAQSINDITNIALYFLSPMVILRAFEQHFSATRFKTFAKLTLAIFLAYLITIIIAQVVFHRVSDRNLHSIVMYSSIYSNNGFMGIPLAQALLGSTGVFYGAASMIGFNVMSWTHGIGLFRSSSNKRSWTQKLRQILLNPNIIAIIVGLLMFVFSFHLPAVVSSFLKYGGQAFTPISMIIIGSNLVNLKLSDIKPNGYLTTALLFRNIVFPLINLVLLWAMGIHGIPLFTTVILAACPVAGLVVLFTLQANGDTRPAVMVMSVSTILSLITIPLLYLCAASLN